MDHLFPIAVQIGTTNSITAVGKFDPWPPKVWTSAPGVEFKAGTNSGKFSVEVATNAPVGPQLIRVFNEQGASGPRFLIVTSEPQIVEQEPNDDFKKPQVFDLFPASVNGRLEKSGDVDSFAVELQADQTLVASLDAYTLASPVDAVLRVVDERGVQVAFNHDDGRTLDPFLAWTAKAAGRYVVQVFGFAYPAQSEIRFTGNDKCVYRLQLSRGPFLHHTIPIGVQRGARTPLRLVGWNLRQHDESSFDGTALTAGIRQAALRLPGLENALSLPVSDGLESMEREPNDLGTNALHFDPPFAMTGCIEKPGDEDRLAFAATKDEKLILEVQSAFFGFPLDAWLKIENLQGKELARNDDNSGDADPMLEWTPSENGTFIVALGNLLHRGGTDYLYRLSVNKAEPAVTLVLSQNAFTITPGTTNELKVSVKRLHGFKAKLTIAAKDLPDGLVLEPLELAEKDKEITLKLIAAPDAKPFAGPMQIVATESESKKEHLAVTDLTSSSVDNGVPGGFNKLVIESCDKPWLTILPPPVQKAEQPK